MKRCPHCNHIETDDALTFCRADGTPLVRDSVSMSEGAGTVQFSPSQGVDATETRILSHDTAQGGASLTTEETLSRPTAQTTVLDGQRKTGGTRELSATRGRKAGVIVAAAVVVALVAGFAFYYLSRKNNTAIESIAVLPFVNEGGNPDVEYLSDGMTESLITSLSQLPKLSVKARSSVFRYKGKDVSPQTVGNELLVQAVLLGRVIQRGDQLTLRLELVDAKTENVIWSEQYNRKQTDLVALQSEIARDVSQKLRARLSGADERLVTKTYTANPEAYRLYLKGRYHLHQFSVDSYDKAVEHFNKAIEIDPAYALAYVGLADTYAEASSALLPPAEAMPKARRAAQKALEIDETLAEAHVSMALVIWWHDWNPSGAEREFKRSIELNPNYALAHLYYGEFLSQQERFNESIAEFKRAQELDPLSSDINSMMVRPYFFMRQYDRTIELAKKAIEMDQHYSPAHRSLGYAYEQKGMYEEAIAEFEKAIELGGRLPYSVATLGRAYAKSGKRGEALKILEELEQPSRRLYASPVRIASIYAALGDKEQAFRWLEKAYHDRTDHLLYLRIDPDLDSLRSDPRFQDLVRRVGLP